MKQDFSEINIEVKGIVIGKESGEKLINAKVVVNGNYKDENSKE